MGFDKAGALAAGYTPAEVDAFIAQDTPTKYTPADVASLKSSFDKGGADYVPQWGQDSPNIYAGTMALLDAIPAAASFAGKAKVGIPLAAATSAAAGYAKRKINGVDTEFADVANDAMKGAGIEGLGRGAGKVFSKSVADPISEWLAGKALKFSSYPNVLTPTEKTDITKTFFDKGLNATEGGWLKLQKLINQYSGNAKTAIQDATDSGMLLNPNEALVKGDMASLLKMAGDRERTAPGYTDAVKKVVNDFAQGGKPLTPNALDQNKMQLQAMAADAFGNNTKSLPAVQAQKQLSAGVRQTLEDNIPGVKLNNSEASKLFDLSPHLARATGRIGNADIIGLKNAVLLPQAFSSSNPTAWATFLNVVMNPQAQILGAKAIRGTGNIASKIPARQAIRSGLEAAMYSSTGGQ